MHLAGGARGACAQPRAAALRSEASVARIFTHRQQSRLYCDGAQRQRQQHRWHRLTAGNAGAGAAGAMPAPEQGDPDFSKPFPRLHEKDVWKRLGVSREASAEEIVSARNYLMTLYKWHNDSREAIELAYDSCLQQSFNTRNKYGIKLPGLRQVRRRRPNPLSRLGDLLDPMVSAKSLLNEGFIYGALCALCLTGMDQSLPLTGAFAYSVYKFQSKRAKAAEAEAEDNGGEEPQGAAKPIVGAILMTGLSLAVGVGLMALVTGPLARFIPPDMVSNLGTTCLVATMGLFSTFLK